MGILYVTTGGNDGSGDGTQGAPFATVNRAITTANSNNASDEIIIADGNYTETSVVDIIVNNVTIRSASGNPANCSITQDSSPTFEIGRGTTGTTFLGLSISNTSGTTTHACIYGAGTKVGNSTVYGIYSVTDCSFGTASSCLYYVGPGSVITRCMFFTNSNGSGIYGIRNAAGDASNSIKVETSFFLNFDKGSVVTQGYVTLLNCTGILDTSTQSTSYIFYLHGDGNIIHNTIAYGGDVSVDYGIRTSTDSSNTVKNCISFGSTRVPYTGTGSPTVTANLLDQSNVNSNGNNVFNDAANGNYTPHTAGIAYHAGNTEVSVNSNQDIMKNTYASPPSIGGYELISLSGWTGGSYVMTVVNPSLGSVIGVSKSNISKVTGT